MDNCAGKLIRSNHRLMGTYVQLMPKMVQRRMEEMESKAAEAATAAQAGAPAAEASPASDSPIASSLPEQEPPLLPSSVTDVGLQDQGSFSKPAGLNIPVELDTAVSKSTTPIEVQLPAATALTPATEAVNPSVLNDAGSGPTYAAGFPRPPTAGTHIESESSGPVIVPSNPASISADVPVSTVAAPTSIESLSGKERAAELPPTPSQ